MRRRASSDQRAYHDLGGGTRSPRQVVLLHAKLCLLIILRVLTMNGQKSEEVSAMGQASGSECSGPTYARTVMNAATVYPTDP